MYYIARGERVMTRVICPICRKVHNTAYNNSDLICNCAEGNSNKATAQEDVLKLGTFDNFSGSGGNTNFYLGATNELRGTKAEIENNLVPVLERNVRGRKKELYRQRDRLTFVIVKDGRQIR